MYWDNCDCGQCVAVVYRAERWAKNDYKSCNLPSAEADDDDGDDGDDVPLKDINYVIGDVLQPQNSDNTDAIIVHCVGT